MILVPLRQRDYNTYRANEITYRARIDDDRIPEYLRERPLITAVKIVRELFTLLIERTFVGLRPTDLVRFCIQADGLDKPISSTLQQVRDFTLEKLLGIVLKVLQSKDKIKLSDGFTVDVITVKRDVGAGDGTRRVINARSHSSKSEEKKCKKVYYKLCLAVAKIRKELLQKTVQPMRLTSFENDQLSSFQEMILGYVVQRLLSGQLL
nr:uncharacterized protein LOC122271364 [Parasteatoda tepidariorum]